MNNLLIRKIKEMARADQYARTEAMKEKISNVVIYAVDGINEYRIHRIIEKFGYPTRKTIGASALRSFWLLIQHQDQDIDLQKSCLEHCGFDKKEKAYLTDRILVNEGKKQIYGTQFYMKNGRLIPRPIQNPAQLDKRRRANGLDSFKKYREKMLRNHKK